MSEECNMYSKLIRGTKLAGVRLMAAAAMLICVSATAQEAVKEEPKAPDSALAAWLGMEFTVVSTLAGTMPSGGKLSFVYDTTNNVVRLCTRTVAEQKGPWKQDFSKACGVTMSFTRGTRYCSAEDVKVGDAEVLASCHRLRSRDVAVQPGETKNAVEINDVVAFLVDEADGTKSMSILVDSPARTTKSFDVIVVRP
jgi:hypothetical protein